MKKLFKILAWLIGCLAVLVAVAAGSVYMVSTGKFNRAFTVTPKPVRIPTDAATVARGLHIAKTRGCMECHGKDLGGAKVVEDGAMGRLYGANLTSGTGGRVAAWKDEDWVRAIRHGVGPDSRGLFLMPSQEFSHLSDDDLAAVIAYIKTVPAVNRDRVAIELGPVTRVLLTIGKMKLAAEEIDHANLSPASVTPGVTVEYGRYVSAGCTGCHGPNFSGGKIDIGPPDWPHAANLTPAGNLAKWSEEDFVRVVRTAKRPDGTELNPVMPRSFGQMDDVELKALYAYFKTLPAAEKGVR